MIAGRIATTHADARLRISYEHADAALLLRDPSVLAVIAFDADHALPDDPRMLRVRLTPDGGTAPLEVWRVGRRVTFGREHGLSYACDGNLLFAAIEIEEGAGGIVDAARIAYARALDHCESSGYCAPLRFWNYADALTEGDGDAERYRHFNVGRAAGIAGRLTQYPAASAIGRPAADGPRTLQIYWLASREGGTALENPRQVSAFHYPRQYGPQSPTFARAILPAGDALPLLLSGTAAVVGHASAHPGDLEAQLDESLRNVDTLIQTARRHRPDLSAKLGQGSILKAYVSAAGDLPRVAEELRQRLPTTPQLVLHAEICRRELMVEVDVCHR